MPARGPPRRRRVPGACRLPTSARRRSYVSREPSPYISRHFGGPVCASGSNRVSQRRQAQCSPPQRPGASGAGLGRGRRLRPPARLPAPPGLGGRLQRGCARFPSRGPRARAAVRTSESRSARAPGPGRAGGRGSPVCTVPRGVRARRGCSPLGRQETRSRTRSPVGRGGQAEVSGG